MSEKSKILSYFESISTPSYKTIEDLWSFCRGHSYIYIYGVCKISSNILEYLRILNIGVEAYVVSDDRIESFSELKADEIPITAVSQVPRRPKTGFILGLPDIFFNDAVYNLKLNGFFDFFMMREHDKIAISQKLRKHTIDSFMFWVFIVDHCNLGCQMCGAFSQLADECYMDIGIFKQDMRRLKYLSGGEYSGGIAISGGEPLLHPLVSDFITFSRDTFPFASLNLFTNGVKLLNMDDSFWHNLRDCEVTIVLTTYPINLDYSAIVAKAELLQVDLYAASNIHDPTSKPHEKVSFKYPLDLSGKQPQGNFICCYEFNACRTLKNGKIHTCSILPNVHVFTQRFGENLVVSEDDYLDIHNAKSFDELMSFMKKPPKFCRYCDVKNRRSIGLWARSKRSRDEYID